MKKSFRVFAILLFFVISNNVFSLDRDNLSFTKKINLGINLADNEEYQEALDIFYSLYYSEKNKDKKYISLYLTCAILNEMGQYNLAEKLIANNETNFDKSKYPSLYNLKNQIQYAIRNSSSTSLTGLP
ncbi:MAG: hypothetical protein H7A23_23025 [Leptospiraceae bacterium]|nr:hypothetical protein [Leptospiraceae bacterium]MCP5497439.1 hypothetical protein [Leptospiraceae bacterium]